MGITRFPNGVSSFGMPVLGGNNIPPTKGNYYWVDSNATMNGTGDFDNPFTSVVSAIAASTANNDDVIIMKQGHAETISAAGTWTPKAGNTIVGLGFGTRKPLISFSAVASTITVSAANVTFINFDTTASIAEVDVCFTISGTNCSLLGVNHRETATLAIEAWVLTTTAAHSMQIIGCNLMQLTAATANAFAITMPAGTDDALIRDNVIQWNTTNNAASGAIIATSCDRLSILNNYITCPQASAFPIKLVTGGSGMVCGNQGMSPNAAAFTNVATVGGAENYFGASTKGGTLIPAA